MDAAVACARGNVDAQECVYKYDLLILETGVFPGCPKPPSKVNKRPVSKPPSKVNKCPASTHPVIRTHPVTGYKSLFVNKGFTKRILELTEDESDDVWITCSAIYLGQPMHFPYRDGLRTGNRIVRIGEKPLFDSSSLSRRKALGLDEAAGLPTDKKKPM
ncbi:hypothetical protein FB45DRAFT_1022342 [Roridomyces roridus]|uniref:TauD/TfdA-like domain-containing protein n=1 Tax=Roridomyces roridus TaxID=1738132 RepID=A0AAD7FWS6_9AGAR|nr:hypothetical protein FB45DRAFT_1022342 [Roridomyces roridus]